MVRSSPDERILVKMIGKKQSCLVLIDDQSESKL